MNEGHDTWIETESVGGLDSRLLRGFLLLIGLIAVCLPLIPVIWW